MIGVSKSILKDKVIVFRLTEEQYNRLLFLLKDKDRNLSKYCRDLIEEDMKRMEAELRNKTS